MYFLSGNQTQGHIKQSLIKEEVRYKNMSLMCKECWLVFPQSIVLMDES
nr:MAG TPA: hypothetical protein [Caudoviricetes sp.]